MADLKISQFADGGLVENTDEIAVVRAGVNTKVTAGSAARYEVGAGSGQIPSVDNLAPVALSNDYEDLGNLPTLGDLAAKNTVLASDIDSESATAGQVPTSDGSGGVTWQDQSGSGTVAASAVSALDPNSTGSTNVQGQLDMYGARIDGDFTSYPLISSGNLTGQLQLLTTPQRISGALSGFTGAPSVGTTNIQGWAEPKYSTGLSTLWVFTSIESTTYGQQWVNRLDGTTWSGWRELSFSPSTTVINPTLPASGSTYTAPENGYVNFIRRVTAEGNLTLASSRLQVRGYGAPSTLVALVLPVSKGDVVTVEYPAGTNTTFRFVYAQETVI